MNMFSGDNPFTGVVATNWLLNNPASEAMLNAAGSEAELTAISNPCPKAESVETTRDIARRSLMKSDVISGMRFSP